MELSITMLLCRLEWLTKGATADGEVEVVWRGGAHGFLIVLFGEL